MKLSEIVLQIVKLSIYGLPLLDVRCEFPLDFNTCKPTDYIYINVI